MCMGIYSKKENTQREASSSTGLCRAVRHTFSLVLFEIYPRSVKSGLKGDHPILGDLGGFSDDSCIPGHSTLGKAIIPG